MKKMILSFFVIFLTTYSFVSAQYVQTNRFEVGARLGYRDFDEDIFGDGAAYGIQASYFFNPLIRLKAYWDFFDQDDRDFDIEEAFDAKNDAEISTFILGIDFLGNTYPFKMYVGGGVGIASIDSDFQTELSNSQLRGDFDEAFIVQVDGGFIYHILEYLTAELELSYTWGNADVDLESSFEGVFDEKDEEIDMDNFGAFLSLNYRFG